MGSEIARIFIRTLLIAKCNILFHSFKKIWSFKKINYVKKRKLFFSNKNW